MNEKKSLKFEEELRDKVFQAKKECNYNPTYFLKMLNEKGGVQTAKDLIEKSLRTGKTSDGYTALFLSGRLDLTMEDSVIKEEYAELFTEAELHYCKEILSI